MRGHECDRDYSTRSTRALPAARAGPCELYRISAGVGGNSSPLKAACPRAGRGVQCASRGRRASVAGCELSTDLRTTTSHYRQRQHRLARGLAPTGVHLAERRRRARGAGHHWPSVQIGGPAQTAATGDGGGGRGGLVAFGAYKLRPSTEFAPTRAAEWGELFEVAVRRDRRVTRSTLRHDRGGADFVPGPGSVGQRRSGQRSRRRGLLPPSEGS